MLKEKKYKFGLMIELVILLLFIIFACLPKYEKSFMGNELILTCGSYEEGNHAHIEAGSIGASQFFVTPYMKLSYGKYEVIVNYSSEGDRNMVYVSTESIMQGKEDESGKYYSDTLILSPDLTRDLTEVYVQGKRNDFVIACYYMGDGDLTIESVTVKKTAGGYLKLFSITFVLFLCMDWIVYLYEKRKNGRLSDETIQNILMLAGIISFTSLPLMLDYMIEGHDLPFHLLRIEGIKDAFKMGVFPAKVQPNWLRGNGYAVSVFYGDILLYFPALLRLLGFNITESYNIFVFCMNAVTCLSAYFCFGAIIKNKRMGVLGAFLYTASLYRIINLYIRTSVGEYSAMAFLPVILYGLWKIFSEDVKLKEYGKNWIYLVIGLSGIINTHILTCEIVGGFIILLCIIMIKKIFRKQTFIVLVKSVVYTIVLNLGFIVPFLQYMLKGGFIVTSGQALKFGIQQFGAFLGQMFIPFTNASGLSVSTMSGMAGEMPAGIGLTFLVGVGIFIYAYATGKINNNLKKLGLICCVFGVISIIFSSNFFPWDRLQSMNRVFDKLISMLQFPWRFLTIASLALTLVTIIGIVSVINKKKETAHIAIILGMICFLQAAYLMSSVMNTSARFGVYGQAGLDNSYIIGGEYLPSGTLTQDFIDRKINADEAISVNVLESEKIRYEVEINNQSENEGKIEFPMVYYDGYRVDNQSSGDKLIVTKSDHGKVQIIVPGNFEGKVSVDFKGYWYWNMAYFISALAFVAIIWQFVVMHIKHSKKEF